MKKPIKISENCWKHNDDGCFFYRKEFDENSDLHREDGPAIEDKNDGYKAWWINGKRHRIDGPAIECSNGYKEWYYHNQYINVNSQEEFELYLKNQIFI